MPHEQPGPARERDAAPGPARERDAAPGPARDWEVLERLATIERPSASDGEGQAAQLIAAELTERGASSRIEPERVHGTYWEPLGLATAAATLAAAMPRVPGAILAGLASASVADDLDVGARPLRRALRQRTAHNVIGEFGPRPGAHTLVVHAHHDAAHTGIVFHPAGTEFAGRLTGARLDVEHSAPAPMWPTVGGPGVVALGQMLGLRWLRLLGAVVSAGNAVAMADIALRRTVPGANDNLSGVWVLLRLAGELGRHPPRRLRVILLSTGAEESLLEAMVRFGERHFSELPRESTTFLCVDSVGSPRLMLLSGEGLLRLYRYPQPLIDRLTELARQNDIPLRTPFTMRLATDAQIPLRAGYPTASISSMDWHGAASNYHWPTDVPERLDRGNVEGAAKLALALARALDG